MILYPFQPDLPFGYSVTGFDEEKKTPGAELYLLPPGAQIPAEFTGGAIFSEAPGCADARILQPAQSAAPDAAGVWADTQVSGGSLEGYARALLARWGERLWMYLRPLCMRFPVPCPTGVGEALGPDEARTLQAQYPSHYSPDLVCRYSFYLDAAGQPRVFLFDTPETCRQKLTLLRPLGLSKSSAGSHKRTPPRRRHLVRANTEIQCKKVQPGKSGLHLLLTANIQRQLLTNLVPAYQAARSRTPVR